MSMDLRLCHLHLPYLGHNGDSKVWKSWCMLMEIKYRNSCLLYASLNEENTIVQINVLNTTQASSLHNILVFNVQRSMQFEQWSTCKNWQVQSFMFTSFTHTHMYLFNLHIFYSYWNPKVHFLELLWHYLLQAGRPSCCLSKSTKALEDEGLWCSSLKIDVTITSGM